MIKLIAWLSFLALCACSSSPKPTPVPVVIQAPVQLPKTAVSSPTSAPPKVEVSVPEGREASVPKRESIYKLKKGKMFGGQPAAKLLEKFKNEKTPGVTTENCWNYGKFAVVEMKSTDEVGSAELTLRLPPTDFKGSLCAKDYEGPRKDLRLIEGHFAGVAGEYVFVDGEDDSEGVLEFQIFNLAGKEIFRSRRHPSEDFTVIEKDGRVSITFFAKVDVRCELAAEGEECWKKVLSQNRLPKTALPDCKSSYEKNKTPLTEDALVTVRAHIANVSDPKLKFLGGQATCAPAP